MICKLKRLRQLGETTAVAAIEFAVALPVFLMATMGILDLAYEQYAGSVLQGVVEKAARDGTLEVFASDQSGLDAFIRQQILAVWPGANVTVTREAYGGFSDLRTRNKPERFTDANNDGKYDMGECFYDANANGKYDKNRGTGNAGNGGAGDVVLLTATITRSRIFPGWQFIGQPQVADIEATMTLRNQPYAATSGGPQMICGDVDGDDD